MKLVRAVGGGLVVAVCLASCNAITGIGDIGVMDDESPRSSEEDAGVPSSPEQSFVASDASVEDNTDIPDATTQDADGDVPVDASLPSDASSSSDAATSCTPRSVGPRYGTVATVTSGGWSFRNGIRAPNDGLFAHTNNQSGTIEVSDFGFALPADARIRGITVRIARTAENGTVTDTVSLPKGQSKTGGAWPLGPAEGPYQTATYGGSSDTWGATWTAEEINDATFSVRLSVTGSGDGHADSIGVIVNYCN